MVDHYTYRITWSAEDREHVGLCAEFPSLSWLAATHRGALTGIRKLVEDVLADMRATGEAPLNLWQTGRTAASLSSVYHRRHIEILHSRQLRKELA